MLTAALAIPFLVPLILAPHLLVYYDITPKVAVLLIGAGVLLAFTSFKLDSLRAFTGTPQGRWYTIACSGSAAMTLLTTATAIHPSLAWSGSNWRRYGALTECAAILAAFLIAAYSAGKPIRVRYLARATCLSGLIASLYGIAQYFGWDPILPVSGYEAGEGVFRIVRPPGPMGHADYFAAFLLWPVFMGIGLAREEQILWRVFGACSAVCSALAIVMTGSRGAFLALAAGIFILAWRFPVTQSTTQPGAAVRSRARLGAFAAAAAATGIALAVLYVSPAGERLRARAHWISEERTGGARLLLWTDSLVMASKRPVRGYGPENFVAEFPRFQSVKLAQAYPDFYHESPHNVFLDALTAQGLGGLLALAGVAAIGAIAGLAGAGPYLFAAFAATVVAHQFIVFTAPTAFYFYLGAGLLAGSTRRNEAEAYEGSASGTGRRGPKPTRRKRAATLGLGVAIFLIAAGFRLAIADHALAIVDRRLDAGDPRGAAEAYRIALRHSGAGVSADLHFSRRWAAVAAQFPDAPSRLYYSQIAAGAATLAAHSPEQQQNAWYNLAVLTASRNDPAGIEYALRSAISLGPNWYKPHWALARLLASEERAAEARDEAALALKLNAQKDAEVAETLAPLTGSRILSR